MKVTITKSANDVEKQVVDWQKCIIMLIILERFTC